jgi:(2Fe-2S) ferredoxin
VLQERETENEFMHKPEYHIFVCNSYRLGEDPQGFCNAKGAPGLLQYIQDEIIDRGIDGMVTSTGCLKICEKGPVMVIYPQGWWYTEVNEERVDEILDALEEGKPVEEILLV